MQAQLTYLNPNSNQTHILRSFETTSPPAIGDTVIIRDFETPKLAWPLETPIKSAAYNVAERTWVFDELTNQTLIQIRCEPQVPEPV